MSLPTLVVTPGDPDGIGPEVVWKSIRKNHGKWKSSFRLLCVGAEAPFKKLGAPIVHANLKNLIAPRSATPSIWLLPTPTQTPKRGQLLAGYQAGWSIQTAVKLIQQKKASALVTGPIHKERFQKGGFTFSGHTDFLANLSHMAEITMMLANSELKVSLVTVHCGIKDVSKRLSRASVDRALTDTYNALTQNWGVKKPHIAVLALNPHAGESGLFGSEETKIITPALAAFLKRHPKQVSLSGPHPADTFFAKYLAQSKNKRPDAVIAIYHDQGLIPVKMIDFPNTVNLSLGLPFVRTSVDHGTAFDIAGKNLADPRSFTAAVELAYRLQKKRNSRS